MSIFQINEDTHNTSITDLQYQARLILDEIAFKKQLGVIRWLGYALTKICLKVYTGVHVNEESIKKVCSYMFQDISNANIIFV